MAIVNPTTGKVLGLARGADGSLCGPASGAPNKDDYGPRVEVQDYDPHDGRQLFVLEDSGKIRSEACRLGNGVALYITPEDVRSDGSWNTNECIGGSTLIFRRGDSCFAQTWKAGVDGTIAIDVNCKKYKKRNLAVAAIEDDDIENYESVYISFVNPASGLALSVEGTDCTVHTSQTRGKVLKVRTHNKDDDKQKFRLVKFGDGYLIRSKKCSTSELSLFLSPRNCDKVNTDLVLKVNMVRKYNLNL